MMIPIIQCRPDSAGVELNQSLQSAGFNAIHFCPLQITPIEHATTKQQLKQLQLDLDNFTDIIVTSRYAVDHGVESLSDYWPQWPLQQKWWAIGDATAQALKTYGIDASTAESPQNSENLLKKIAAHWREDPKDCRKVALIKGKDGLKIIEKSIQESDTFQFQPVRFTTADVYQRIQKTFNQQEHNDLKQLFSKARALIVTSNDILKALLNLNLIDIQRLKMNKSNDHCLELFVSSQRVEAYASHLGAKCVINLGTAKNTIIVSKLCSHFGVAPATERLDQR